MSETRKVSDQGIYERVYCPRCHRALRRDRDGRLIFRPVDIEEYESVQMVHISCLRPQERLPMAVQS